MQAWGALRTYAFQFCMMVLKYYQNTLLTQALRIDDVVSFSHLWISGLGTSAAMVKEGILSDSPSSHLPHGLVVVDGPQHGLKNHAICDARRMCLVQVCFCFWSPFPNLSSVCDAEKAKALWTLVARHCVRISQDLTARIVWFWEERENVKKFLWRISKDVLIVLLRI